jgi:hypothetical protein
MLANAGDVASDEVCLGFLSRQVCSWVFSRQLGFLAASWVF